MVFRERGKMIELEENIDLIQLNNEETKREELIFVLFIEMMRSSSRWQGRGGNREAEK